MGAISLPSFKKGFYTPKRGGRNSNKDLWRGCMRYFAPYLGYTHYSIYDHSGYGYGSTVESPVPNVPSWANSRNGQQSSALFFPNDGDVDYYTSFSDSGLPTGVSDISLELWASCLSTSGTQCYFTFGNVSGGGVASFGKNISILINGGVWSATNYGDGVNGSVPVVNKLTHIIASFDSRSKVMTIYINGAKIATGIMSVFTRVLSGTGYLGAMNDHGLRYPANGIIYQAAIYNRVIGDGEAKLRASDMGIMTRIDRSHITANPAVSSSILFRRTIFNRTGSRGVQ